MESAGLTGRKISESLATMFPPSVSFSGLSCLSLDRLSKGLILVLLSICTQSIRAQTNLVELRSFGATAFSGSQPEAKLLAASDGYLYGTTPFGGSSGDGTIFRIRPDGSAFTVLKQLSFTNSGATPYAGVIEGKDGFLYGTTYSGGARGLGTVFKMSKDGLTYTVLRHFGLSFGDGNYPRAGLVESFNGFLYGTTTAGGTSGFGTVFRIARDGSNYSVLRSFAGGENDGDTPNSGLVEGPSQEGFLYGTTHTGGSNDVGTVYRINTNGSSFKVLLSPAATPGSPEAIDGGVIVGRTDGFLYGMSRFGGTNDSGTIFRLDRNGGNFSVLRHFAQFNDAIYPGTQLLEGSDGLLYGVTSQGGTNNNRGTIFTIGRTGTGYKLLHHFGASLGDAFDAASPLIESTNTLYCLTRQGGLSGDGALVRIARTGTNYAVVFGFSSAGGDGFTLEQSLLALDTNDLFGVTRDGGKDGGGTVYRIQRHTTNYTILHHFGPGTTNLLNPSGTLLDGQDGFFYGSALFGGANGFGGVYRLATNGTGFQIVRDFTAIAADGRLASGPLWLGSDGALYGTTRMGGSSSTGMVFRLAKDGGDFLPLHNFTGGNPDGAGPQDGVVEVNGMLYGTTPYGGPADWGVLFRVGTFGDGYQRLHSFGTNATDGIDPSGGLLKASDGRLYGATRGGGTGGLGALYRFDPANSSYAVIVNLTNASTQGQQPVGRLVEGADGLLYGATSAGGSFNVGTLYRVAKDGTGFTTVYHFGGGDSGRLPAAGLALGGTDLFGTTSAGGTANLGTVFRFIAPPPAPTITAHPQSLIVAPGAPALLAVSATGSGTLAYQWQRNGVDIAGANAATHLIESVVFADGGNYRALVSGAGGSAESGNAAVVVFAGTNTGNALQLQLAGPMGRTVTLQARTNLQPATAWQTFSNVVLQGTLRTVTDPQAATRPERYFRAVLP